MGGMRLVLVGLAAGPQRGQAQSMEIKQPSVPDGLLRALERWRGDYTDARSLYQCLWFDGNVFCGVFGDGPNGMYEWFIWEAGPHEPPKVGKLRTSNTGFGSDAAALLAVLRVVEAE
jgi:hypothetical protein